MRGLWKKLDHEKGLRRSKAKKEPYVKNFVEPAIQTLDHKRPFSLQLSYQLDDLFGFLD